MRFINPVPQFWLDNGDLASSSKMYFYENKDYSTPKDTYSQPDNTIPNTNPVILDGQGRMPPCFGDGLYSVKFYSADGSLQWTRDDVSLSAESGQMEIWLPAARYTINDIVKDPVNGDYYQLYGSPISLGDQPSSSLNLWQKIVFITEYNINKTYKIDEIVKKEGFLYRSLEDNNTDSPPSSKWANLTFNDSIAGDFLIDGNLTVTGTINGLDIAPSVNSSVFTASAGRSGSANGFKIGNVAFVNFSIAFTGITANPIFTLPAGWRPTSVTRGSCNFILSATNESYSKSLTIDTSGNINFSPSPIPSDGSFSGMIFFIFE